jgi:Zn-dependent protease with chaperone function
LNTPDKNELRNFSDDVKEYINAQLQIIGLNVTEKVAFAFSNFITTGLSVVLLLLTIVFVSLGGAFWLGGLVENTSIGFLLMGAFYLFVFIIIRLFFSKGLKSLLMNILINDLTNDQDDDTDDKIEN